ncbi:TIGR04219 family outer membrane beta-barrel protein [Colwellia sp. 1_MG-2023]|uniref:TIGR04219 family outer membrane beta-barrel protein n=1 Tax=Colwellia sp. 1_MG-2023 TaxID=3062649 RepID=UPI0026E3203D|nr:TIGR04219 family outer membrane beta-barrel protein [Colwellia sp. 1_MG-2023]MDO6445188.1 TIGR04219 family outer membrane beta-barrel protein [Colwellia sp. 1_MG-2023]
MKKALLTASVFTLLSGIAQADTLAGLYIGGQVWDTEATGIFGESNNQVNFNLSDKQQGSYFIAVEHPIPFIPNAKIAKTSLETQGNTTLDREITFDDNTFIEGSVVDAGFNVSYVDYTLYYELFDNGLFSFDIGLTGRDFNGDVTVTGPTISVDNEDDCPETPQGDICPSPDGTYTPEGIIKTDEIVPMLYASTIVGLPFTGFNIFAEGNFLSIDDHTLYDYQAGLSYELVDNLAIDVNITLGYRSVKLALEDLSNLYSDLEFKGAFVGAVVHF